MVLPQDCLITNSYGALYTGVELSTDCASCLQLYVPLPVVMHVVMPETLTLQIKFSFAGSERKAGRPVGDAWNTFKTRAQLKSWWQQKISGKVADLRTHAANCKKTTQEAKLAARIQQVKAGGDKASSQTSLESCADTGTDKLGREQNNVCCSVC